MNLRRLPGGVAAGAILAIGALALTGCSADSLAADDVEEKIASSLTDQGIEAPESVDCPEDLPAEEGATIECVIDAPDGNQYGVAVEATSVDGDHVEFHIEVDDKPMK